MQRNSKTYGRIESKAERQRNFAIKGLLPLALIAFVSGPLKAQEVLDRFRDCTDCPEMVVIPAGSFRMGSSSGEEGRNGNEGPVHEVLFERSFALARHEVTVAEFRRFVQATKYRTHCCPINFRELQLKLLRRAGRRIGCRLEHVEYRLADEQVELEHAPDLVQAPRRRT